MVERREHLRLALEPGKTLAVSRDRFGQDFDGHIATELRVFGPVDLPHTTLTQLGGDLEVRQRLIDQGAEILSHRGHVLVTCPRRVGGSKYLYRVPVGREGTCTCYVSPSFQTSRSNRYGRLPKTQSL